MGAYFSSPEPPKPTKAEPNGFCVPTVVEGGGNLPARASADAAGYDLCAAEDALLEPGTRSMVGTGVKTAIQNSTMTSKFAPDQFVIHGQVRGRSGLAKKGIDVFQGTVDADYRGEIKVILINNSDVPFEIKRGDRIAQLVFLVTLTPSLLKVTDLDVTERGEGGFGSTGVRDAAAAEGGVQAQSVAVVVEGEAPASEAV